MRTAILIVQALVFFAAVAASGEPPVPPSALPEVSEIGPILEEEDAVTVYVERSGAIILSGKRHLPPSMEKTHGERWYHQPYMLSPLYRLAEERRDPDHPSGANPCTRAFIVHADAGAPWAAVRLLLVSGARLEVRIYRWYLAARRGGSEEVGVVPYFLTLDPGLDPPDPELLSTLPAQVELAHTESQGTRFRLQGRDIGTGTGAFRALKRSLGQILTRSRDQRTAPDGGLLCSDAAVPFARVVRTLVLMRSAGVQDVVPEECELGPYLFHGTSEEGLKDLQKRCGGLLTSRLFPDRPPLPEGAVVLDKDLGISPSFRKLVAAKERWRELAKNLEWLIVRADDLDALLRQDRFTERDVRALRGSWRRDPILLTALAEANLQIEGLGECRKAVNALKVLSYERPRYTRRWWFREYLCLSALHRLGKVHGEEDALESIRTRCRRLEALGLLGGSPYEAGIRRIVKEVE